MNWHYYGQQWWYPQYPPKYPYPTYPYSNYYLCWCGQYHWAGHNHPIVAPAPVLPKPRPEPGKFGKKDLDKAKKVLTGK